MAGNGSIIDDSHDFWDEVVLPLLQVRFPEETAQMAAGFFGYGSEVLRLDDDYSTDHHFGLRVNILLPEALMAARGVQIEDGLAADLPQHWRGRELREGYTRTKGVALASSGASPALHHRAGPPAAKPDRVVEDP